MLIHYDFANFSLRPHHRIINNLLLRLLVPYSLMFLNISRHRIEPNTAIQHGAYFNNFLLTALPILSCAPICLMISLIIIEC